jgi:hypothetical protein
MQMPSWKDWANDAAGGRVMEIPAYIERADGQFIAARMATLADWLAASRSEHDKERKQEINWIIELARSQDIDPGKPLLPQLQGIEPKRS